MSAGLSCPRRTSKTSRSGSAASAVAISMRDSRHPRTAALCAIALLAAACSGGGSSDGTSPPPAGGAGPAPPTLPPSPPPPNRGPDILIPMRSERVITGHPVEMELIVAPIFSDPDGDPLTITVDWAMRTSTPGAWNGLRIVGDRIEGIAAQPDVNAVSISADDGRGGLSIYRIELTVAANQAPMVPTPAPDKLVGIGEAIRFDATQSGTLFVDPDGDLLTYSVRLEPAPRGLQVTGTTVTGQLSAIGAVRLIVTASDGFGGVGSDMSMVAAPAPPPGPPQLPINSYAYDDSLLDWPEIFRLSR